MERKKIAIVGVGLIGGSLALRLHEKKLSSRIIGVEQNLLHAKTAMQLELVDEIMNLDDAIAYADVIILCIPVNEIVYLLPRILDKVEQQIVIDLGSTKSEPVQAVLNHPRRGRYVASHPMWGTEFSGPASAQHNAFTEKAVIICNSQETDKDALEWTLQMYKKIGMHVVEMESAPHDLHAAYVSHISHITSFALANTVLEKEKEEQAIFELASAGFDSTVRLAKSSANMWVPILLQNKINVLDVLNEHIDQLTRFRDCIENSDETSLRALIENANRIRKII